MAENGQQVALNGCRVKKLMEMTIHIKLHVSTLDSDNVSGKGVKRSFSVTLSLGRSATHVRLQKSWKSSSSY